MKKILIIASIAIVLIGGCVALAFYGTSGLTEAAGQFFGLVQNNKIDEAYASTSKEFKNNTSLDQFKGLLKTTGIENYASASWSSRSLTNNIGELEGEIKTKDNATLPTTVSLVKEDEVWKIYGITPKSSGVQAGEVSKPKDEEMKTMVRKNLVSFAEAIKEKDFTDFYDSISDFWKAQTRPEEILKAFQSFIDQKIDMDFVSSDAVTFNEPPKIETIQEHQILKAKGYISHKPYSAFFELWYLYEHPQWKLVQFKVEAR